MEDNFLRSNFHSLKHFCVLIYLSFFNISAFAVDCTTIADYTWDCGTPAPNDNLTVNHPISITNDFNASGIITINNGGNLTITGNVTASGCNITVKEGGTLVINGAVVLNSNGILMIEGNVHFGNTLTLQNSARLITIGSISVNGNVLIEQGATLEVQPGATFFTKGNFESNSNAVTIDGEVTTEGDFINKKSITGTGKIHYDGSCSGPGKINKFLSHVYCGYNPIDLVNISCIISDTSPPEINDIPDDITVYLLNNTCEIAVDWIPPTITDDCELQTVTPSHEPSDIFQVGSTTVTYSAVDMAGNSNEKSFIITVIDNIPPSINNLPADITQSAEACGAIVNWALPTATDNCSASLNSSHNPGDFFIVGTTTVTYTAMDIHENSTVIIC